MKIAVCTVRTLTHSKIICACAYVVPVAVELSVRDPSSVDDFNDPNLSHFTHSHIGGKHEESAISSSPAGFALQSGSPVISWRSSGSSLRHSHSSSKPGRTCRPPSNKCRALLDRPYSFQQQRNVAVHSWKNLHL